MMRMENDMLKNSLLPADMDKFTEPTEPQKQVEFWQEHLVNAIKAADYAEQQLNFWQGIRNGEA